MQVTLVSKALDVLLMVALAYMPTHTGNLGMTLALIAVQLTRGVCSVASVPSCCIMPTGLRRDQHHHHGCAAAIHTSTIPVL